MEMATVDLDPRSDRHLLDLEYLFLASSELV
jgi:hypothetical protein